METKLLHLVPMGLLSAFTLKLLAFGTSPSEMGVVAALCAVVYGTEYLSKSRRIQKVEEQNKLFSEALSKKVEDQAVIITKQNEVINALAKELEVVRNAVSSVKMAAGFNPSAKRTG